MPRDVVGRDAADRVAAAVLQMTAAHGLDAVSMRDVAARAGVSLGRVQRLYGSKDGLLLHSLTYAHRCMEQRIEVRLSGTAGGDRDVLMAVLTELIGEDGETRDAIRVHLAYAARAINDDRIAAVLTDGDAEILTLAESVIAQARDEGRAPPDTNPHQAARALLALAGGLGTGVALYGDSPSAARVTLEYQLHRVAPAAGPSYDDRALPRDVPDSALDGTAPANQPGPG